MSRSEQAFRGAPSEIALDVFLSHGGQGPEYQALAEALANLEVAGKKPDDKILSAEEIQQLDHALGKAVARCWGNLTPEIQHDLFEAAVLSEGETIRQLLAVYLHGKPRVRLIWCKRGPCRNRKAWAVSVG
jgi:hypothetical protein